MATIQKRRTRQGQNYFTATIRLKGFKSASRTFERRDDAKRWAQEQEKELKRQRDRGGLRRDVSRMTVAQLIKEYLEDPETTALRYFDHLSMLLAWWVGQYGAMKLLELNVFALREARHLLQPGRAGSTVNRYLSAMRSCWNWGRAAGIVPQDQTWPSRLMLKEPRAAPAI